MDRGVERARSRTNFFALHGRFRNVVAVQRMNEPSGTLKGKENIRPYWSLGFEQNPPLRFELSDVLTGANSITILYRNQKNISVAEVLIFNADGKANNGFAHYAEKSEL